MKKTMKVTYFKAKINRNVKSVDLSSAGTVVNFLFPSHGELQIN